MILTNKRGKDCQQQEFLPKLKQIIGVKRAIKVACGIDHTIVLIGASIPAFGFKEDNNEVISMNNTNNKYNSQSPPSLKNLCELAIAKSSNLRNIISVLNVSKYVNCSNLYTFAIQFILRYFIIIIF